MKKREVIQIIFQFDAFFKIVLNFLRNYLASCEGAVRIQKGCFPHGVAPSQQV